MRSVYVVSLTLALAVATVARGEPAQTALQDRYIKACIKDGDTETYCRCEWGMTKETVKDPNELEFIVTLAEQLAGQPEAAQDEILKKLPATQLQRIIQLSEHLAEESKKCPEYRKRN